MISSRKQFRQGYHGLSHHEFAGALVAFFCAVLAFGSGQCFSEDLIDKEKEEDPIWKIEVDWEIRIPNPDFKTSSPQISLIISAFDHLDSWHGELVVNCSEYSTAANDGGISTRLWNGEQLQSGTFARTNEPINILDERIDVTQVLSLEEGANGLVLWSKHLISESTTWGVINQFGGGSSNHNLTNLNNFNWEITFNESGVNVGRNRVERLRIKQIRLYHQSGAVSQADPLAEVHAGLLGTTSSITVINPNGTFSTTQPIDQKTLDAVNFSEGF